MNANVNDGLDIPAMSNMVAPNDMTVDDFPQNLVMIALGNGKYAANNASTPDNMQINGLATFINSEEALVYSAETDIVGTLERKTLGEAREIAKSKPNIHALFLMFGKRIADIHYVN